MYYNDTPVMLGVRRARSDSRCTRHRQGAALGKKLGGGAHG